MAPDSGETTPKNGPGPEPGSEPGPGPGPGPGKADRPDRAGWAGRAERSARDRTESPERAPDGNQMGENQMGENQPDENQPDENQVDENQVHGLRRLLAPRHIAVIGGASAAEAIRQCRAIGYTGELWPVHPRRDALEGLPCYRSVGELPRAPDAALLAVPNDATVPVLAELSARGAGGAVCYAAGFAEDGEEGARLQDELRDAAGDMPVIGPNCIGMLNYLDGAALWADQHGGDRVRSGAALLTQSGNIGQNMTMQRRSVPLAHVITAGNAAVTGIPQLIEAMLEDARVTAIGLHLEGIDDVGAFSRAALHALRRGVPIVALKTGTSKLGAQANLSHTSSLAGSDVLCDALFRRLGIARVHDVGTFLETLKFLHVHGALDGVRITSASCSGGEAALVADAAQRHGAELPELPEKVTDRLQRVLGERVRVANPLDYHTFIWGDAEAQRECFTALLGSGFDMNLLLLDLPRDDRCAPDLWTTTLDAYLAAQRSTGAPACVVSSLPEGVPEETGERLLASGVAPIQGVADGVRAIAAARAIGAAQQRAAAEGGVPLPGPASPRTPRRAPERDMSARGARLPERPDQLDERTGKLALAAHGVPVPSGTVAGTPRAGARSGATAAAATADGTAPVRPTITGGGISHEERDVAGHTPAGDAAAEAAALAAGLGFPVVAKALSASLAHKSEAGAVHVNLADESAVREAVTAMAPLSDQFLIERMVQGAVAELIVGVHHDPQFGLALTLGAGGVLVELAQDTACLLLPTTREEVEAALASLRIWPVLRGFRGRPAGDVRATVDAVCAVAAYARAEAVAELDVNPLLVLEEGHGAVAVDALIRHA